ncbi:MAG: hypothetical protein RLZZ437_64 [Pseudomonadota bacterium]|jgi:LysR family glycine cleavage system transcriptional activator
MAVLPPTPRDLPLNALRAFEAAARLGGFVPAAAELGVTPGAVTAHVKTLEAMLGAKLFDRVSKGVVLTPAGQMALPSLTAAFDQMAHAARDLREAASPRVVHIATLPAIAQLWLAPRMPALRGLSADMSISITAMEQPPNLKRAAFDLCLFFGGSEGDVVAVDDLFPVCAPALAGRLRNPADLAQVPCLSDSVWNQDWACWLQAVGAKTAVKGPVFSLYALAVEEATSGAGVLIGHAPLVAAHLAAGHLVRPFAESITSARDLRLWSARPLRRGSAADQVARALRGQANAA